MMIWGCFIKAGFGHTCLCEGCMKQVTYQVEVILEENFLHSVLTVVFTNYEVCIFQQDNDPYHTARSIKVWMRTTRSRPCHGQPNLQTKPHWKPMTRRKMDSHMRSNNAKMLSFLHQEWHNVSKQQCERLMGESYDWKSMVISKVKHWHCVV